MEKVDTQVYFRGIDPTPIREVVMLGFNTATRIGGAICLPGDVVFGAGGGVLFIPSHLVAEVVDGAAKTHVKDIFGFEMITANIFTTAQIDRAVWTEDMLDRLMDFIQKIPGARRPFPGLERRTMPPPARVPAKARPCCSLSSSAFSLQSAAAPWRSVKKAGPKNSDRPFCIFLTPQTWSRFYRAYFARISLSAWEAEFSSRKRAKSG